MEPYIATATQVLLAGIGDPILRERIDAAADAAHMAGWRVAWERVPRALVADAHRLANEARRDGPRPA